MAVVVLPDVVLPEAVISAGVRGRQVRKNVRTFTGSGVGQVNIEWDRTLRQFEVGYIPMDEASWQALEGLFEVTDAGAYGFLMLDPKDSSVSLTNGLLQPWNSAMSVGVNGVGHGEPVLRLTKRIVSIGSSQYRDRFITRPRAVAIRRNGTPVTVGAGAGNVSIDLNTGKVTFVADSSQGVQAITAGASTVLTFSNNTGMYAAMAVGQRVFLSGVSGTAAAPLNGRSHEISAKSASSPYTLTIATSSAGLSGTGGTALKYPQATDALTWSGRFYVPVQFSADEMDWQLMRSGSAGDRVVAGPSVLLMEILESLA